MVRLTGQTGLGLRVGHFAFRVAKGLGDFAFRVAQLFSGLSFHNPDFETAFAFIPAHVAVVVTGIALGIAQGASDFPLRPGNLAHGFARGVLNGFAVEVFGVFFQGQSDLGEHLDPQSLKRFDFGQGIGHFNQLAL